jgi:hypothetical protein
MEFAKEGKGFPFFQFYSFIQISQDMVFRPTLIITFLEGRERSSSFANIIRKGRFEDSFIVERLDLEPCLALGLKFQWTAAVFRPAVTPSFQEERKGTSVDQV